MKDDEEISGKKKWDQIEGVKDFLALTWMHFVLKEESNLLMEPIVFWKKSAFWSSGVSEWPNLIFFTGGAKCEKKSKRLRDLSFTILR